MIKMEFKKPKLIKLDLRSFTMQLPLLFLILALFYFLSPVAFECRSEATAVLGRCQEMDFLKAWAAAGMCLLVSLVLFLEPGDEANERCASVGRNEKANEVD